jgi:PPOX class probable F420-dependent enzyme
MNDVVQAHYVSLATFRKSGVMVATPVWAAFEDGTYFVFSAGEAGKVKRLRNSERARLAKCDARGNLLGNWHEADAQLLRDQGQIEQALGALRKKYGFQMWLADAAAKLLGKFNKRVYIGLTLVEV